MSLAIQSVLIISTIIAFKTFSISAAEPTVIFLGPNGVRPVDGSSGSNNNGGVMQPQTISNRDEGSSKFDFYSISNAIKERIAERSAKKSGPRIIVIPQQSSSGNNVQRSTYNPSSSGQPSPSYGPSSFGAYGQGYTYSGSSPYAYASPYASASSPYASASSPYASASSPYASASSYANSYAYPPYSSYASSYPSYSQPSYSAPSYGQPQASASSSYGSYAAASTPYATYAYPSASTISNYFSSLNPFSSIMSRINPLLMYPQLAALTQSLY